MKIKVEAEVDIDLKAFNITEIRKLIAQLLSPDRSKIIRKTKITNVELLSNPLDG